MNKKTTILLIRILLNTLPVLAIIGSSSYGLGKTLKSEKCSSETEGLKLCSESSKITVKLGEPVKIKLQWVNSSNIDRRIGTSSSGYTVVITDEKGNRLIPIFQQRQMQRQMQANSLGNKPMTGEDINEMRRTMRGGSDRGIRVDANKIENDEIKLTEVMYDYDLTTKGVYYVTISKKVASLENEKTIEFVLDNIEIEVK